MEQPFAVRWSLLSVLLAGVAALRITRYDVPSHVLRGKSMNLSCDYDTNGQKLYQVKWYKDDKDFYSYTPGKPERIFDMPGVNVNVKRSTGSSVLLESVSLSSEGSYTCEVTLDQSFITVCSHHWVTVVELPQRSPVISGDFQDSMSEGDRVSVNCTSYRSRPAAQLTWYINGARSDSGLLRWYESVADVEDLRTVTLGLDFRLRGSHFGPTGHVTLKCTAEIESVFYSSADISITSRTLAMESRFGSGDGLRPLSPARTLFFLACYLLWPWGC